MRRTWLAAGLLVAVAAAGVMGPGPARAKEGVSQDAMNRFLCLGVLEGLLEDGVPDDVVAAVLEKDEKGGYRNFVYACPVCAPVVDAFRCYAMRSEPKGWYYAHKGDPYSREHPFGTSLPEPLLKALRAEKREDRLAAMEKLVSRYVNRRFALQRFTAEERDAMEEALVVGRKKGMSFLKSDDGIEKNRTEMSTCPSCDGANEWTLPK